MIFRQYLDILGGQKVHEKPAKRSPLAMRITVNILTPTLPGDWMTAPQTLEGIDTQGTG